MSKKATAKEKAQRQQHRKDHFTDADRQLFQDYKGDQKGRRDARMQGMSQQGNKTAADFNFDQYGKGHVSGAEVKTLRNQGQSRADIMSAAKSSGAELGKRTQKKFARWDAKAAAKEESQPETPTSTSTPDPQKFLEEKKQPIKDSFNTTDSFNTNQEQSFDRNFGNSESTIGDNNTIYGNFSPGNQDFSVNIGSQNAGPNGNPGNTSGMSNMQSAAAYTALNENDYERSRAKYNAFGEAAKYGAAAEQLTGSNEMFNAINESTDATIDYYGKEADRMSLQIYGDKWNRKAPTWKSPGALDKIETTYDKDEDE